MIEFRILNRSVRVEMLGMIPEFLSERNPEPAKIQLDRNYRHGGGWSPMEGFKLGKDMSLSYPGDPPMKPWAEAALRDELIYIYPHAWVMILQPDMSFEVARMD
jgi:hypothetical protein